MTSIPESLEAERADVKAIIVGGALLGTLTAIGVAVFVFLSRSLSGTVETAVQSLLIVVGGMTVAYFPAAQVRPRSVDSIAWSAMTGLIGALVFTVLDTAILRPLDLYDWQWDAIGGGSGWWYVPVWWMGAAVLAWLGAWVIANMSQRGATGFMLVGVQSGIIALVVFAILVLTGITPLHSAAMGLAVVLGLVVHVVLSAVMSRR